MDQPQTLSCSSNSCSCASCGPQVRQHALAQTLTLTYSCPGRSKVSVPVITDKLKISFSSFYMSVDVFIAFFPDSPKKIYNVQFDFFKK